MNANKYKFIKQFVGLLLAVFLLSTAIFAQAQPKYGARILLVPLDDRPPTLQFPIKMGLIGDAEIVSPPREILGRFTEPGQSEKIIEWFKTQDLKAFDAAIVSLDMLAYGGLVASRVHNVPVTEALKRIEILRELKKRAPKMPVYGSSVIMRLAPTGTGANESYREKLARWADFSPYSDEKSRMETAKLEKEIPAAALEDYKRARARNLAINMIAVELVRNKNIDYLILSQDDAKPRGIHVADREKLIAETRRLNLGEKIAVQPGADEVSMLLLARALNNRFNRSPKIKAVYSSEELGNTPMPFEDRPLRQTVSYHIKAVGAQEVADEKQADLLFYVYASRFESGRAESFAAEIENKIKQGKRIIVADVDPKGDVQGGDPKFTEELEKRNLFPELNGYASWNTAGNTIGTTLPQGVIFAVAQDKFLKSKSVSDRIWTAQNWFTFHRVIDDFYYHNLVRAEARNFITQNKWNSLRLTDEATKRVEDFSTKPLQNHFVNFGKEYFTKRENSMQKNVQCENPSNMTFDLPWNRTFEAEIDFQLACRNAQSSGN